MGEDQHSESLERFADGARSLDLVVFLGAAAVGNLFPHGLIKKTFLIGYGTGLEGYLLF